MVELRPGERYCFSLEGGVCVVALLCEATDRQVVIAPPDVVPWSARLRLPRKSVYAAERVWQPQPRVVDPHAVDWFDGPAWLIWKPGTEPELPDRRRKVAKSKPLFPDAIPTKEERCKRKRSKAGPSSK